MWGWKLSQNHHIWRPGSVISKLAKVLLMSSNINTEAPNFKKWCYCCTRKSIFDPTMDRFWLIEVLMVLRKGRPHGYDKWPGHVNYSLDFLKVVRVREVLSSNLGTQTRHVSRLPTRGSLFLFNSLISDPASPIGWQSLYNWSVMIFRPPGMCHRLTFVSHRSPAWLINNFTFYIDSQAEIQTKSKVNYAARCKYKVSQTRHKKLNSRSLPFAA
jgi:hypothetical protein